MEFDFVGRDELAARAPERVPFAFAAPGNDDDAVPARALRRLDDETLQRFDDPREFADIGLVLDNAVEFGHGHACCRRELFRQHLVVDARIEASRVQPHDEIGIAFIQPEHRRGSQGANRAQHQLPASALKRVNSSKR